MTDEKQQVKIEARAEIKAADDKPKNDGSIFVGGKPFMNYVTGVVMQFTTKSRKELIIKARGKFISRAVDIAEVSTKRFLDGTVIVKDIKIDSQAFVNEEKKDVRVSTIEITLQKK